MGVASTGGCAGGSTDVEDVDIPGCASWLVSVVCLLSNRLASIAFSVSLSSSDVGLGPMEEWSGSCCGLVELDSPGGGWQGPCCGRPLKTP